MNVCFLWRIKVGVDQERRRRKKKGRTRMVSHTSGGSDARLENLRDNHLVYYEERIVLKNVSLLLEVR